MRRRADATDANRVPFVDSGFAKRMRELIDGAPPRPSLGPPLPRATLLALFRSQLESRHVDLCARELKKEGQSFYTIGSAGHEGNAVVAEALRSDDPALLHYRSGAFFVHRARQAGYDDALRDMMLGIVASSDEPIAGGRHKVFGSAELSIPPQTSTIASHLPKSVGMAFALERGKRLALDLEIPGEAVVMCSFGDASANHSTAVGAINAACWAAHQGAPVPVLFVCEDNGLGISVATPKSWIEESYGSRTSLRYVAAEGTDVEAAIASARAAVDFVRTTRRPAFLHLRVVRLLGHAGSDVETMYRSLEDIETTEALDPVVRTAEIAIARGHISPEDAIEMYEATRSRVAELGQFAARQPKLTTSVQVTAPLAPRDDEAIAAEVERPHDRAARAAFWGDRLPEADRPAPLGPTLNRCLGDLLVKYPELMIFGEDVAQKGGVYGVTRGLARRAQRGRVFDTLLDEQTILGTAIGAAQIGCLPIPEIQYLAYLHNAVDQLRGEAATLSFFAQAQFKNPMVVRIASYAYQKGFGGHFHNDNSIASLRDIPGLVIASPARGDDACAMLRTCVAAADQCGSVCLFLEPIALYPVRDLHEAGDGGWCTTYDPDGEHVPIGRARVHGDGDDLCIVTWANGLYMSLRAAERLRRDHGVQARVLDLRWIAPLPVDDLVRHASATGRVLIVDETRRTGSVSEALITALSESDFEGHIARVTADDCFIPLGEAANLVLVQEDDIERAAHELLALAVGE